MTIDAKTVDVDWTAVPKAASKSPTSMVDALCERSAITDPGVQVSKYCSGCLKRALKYACRKFEVTRIETTLNRIAYT